MVLAVLFFDLVLSLMIHGKPRRGTHNALITSIVTAVWLFLLYQGGFFH